VHRFALGKRAQAVQVLQRALEISMEGGNILYELMTRPALATIAADAGDAGEALPNLERRGEPVGAGEKWFGLAAIVERAEAVVAAAQRDYPVAEAHFEKAIATFQHYSNPHNVALRAYFSSFDTISLGDPTWGPFEADGLVELNATTLRSALVVQHSRFLGAAGDGHGFFAPDVKTPLLLWQSVELHNGAIVDLSSARVGLLLDDRESWPRPGNLLIDGLTYDNFGAGAPADARTRLQWISLESGGFPAAALSAIGQSVGGQRR
jgi:hypothetical protein